MKYWIAFSTSSNQNSGRKKTRDEALAWAADIMSKHINIVECNLAEVQSVLRRTTPILEEQPLSVDVPVQSGNGQHDSLREMDF